MSQVVATKGTAQGLERCREFLAAKRSAKPSSAILLLETVPDLGRSFAEMSELRELVIAFGIPAMWFCTAMSRPTMQCMSWHFGTRKRRVTDAHERISSATARIDKQMQQRALASYGVSCIGLLTPSVQKFAAHMAASPMKTTSAFAPVFWSEGRVPTMPQDGTIR